MHPLGVDGDDVGGRQVARLPVRCCMESVLCIHPPCHHPPRTCCCCESGLCGSPAAAGHTSVAACVATAAWPPAAVAGTGAVSAAAPPQHHHVHVGPSDEPPPLARGQSLHVEQQDPGDIKLMFQYHRLSLHEKCHSYDASKEAIPERGGSW